MSPIFDVMVCITEAVSNNSGLEINGIRSKLNLKVDNLERFLLLLTNLELVEKKEVRYMATPRGLEFIYSYNQLLR